jgi:VanZ family protein
MVRGPPPPYNQQRMERPYLPGPQVRPSLRWLTWGVFVAAWTLLLLTTEPVHVADAVLPQAFQFPTAKALHVSAYAFLAVLSAWLPVRRPYRWLLLGFLSLHAMGTEFLQQFVPERGPSVWDVLIDHFGMALGVAASWRWWRRP